MSRKKVLGMEANEFVSLCKRLPAYAGALRATVAQAHSVAPSRMQAATVPGPASARGVQRGGLGSSGDTPPEELARLRWEQRIRNAPERARQDGKFEEVDMTTASDADVMAFIAS